MGLPAKVPLILPRRKLILPNERRKLPRPAPWIWVPKRFAPRMAVSFGTSGVADTGVGTNVTTWTKAFNIGTLTNGAVVFAVYLASGSSVQPSAVTATYGGVSMFSIGSVLDSATFVTEVLFGLINPSNGSNNLVLNWTTAANPQAGFWSFSGTDQTANSTTFINFATAPQSSGTTDSKSITTVSGNATVFGWDCGQDPTGVSGNTPTPDWINNSGIAGGAGVFPEGQHTLSSSTSDTYNVAISVTDTLMGCGCSIKASAGADTLASNTTLLMV